MGAVSAQTDVVRGHHVVAGIDQTGQAEAFGVRAHGHLTGRRARVAHTLGARGQHHERPWAGLAPRRLGLQHGARGGHGLVLAVGGPVHDARGGRIGLDELDGVQVERGRLRTHHAPVGGRQLRRGAVEVRVRGAAELLQRILASKIIAGQTLLLELLVLLAARQLGETAIRCGACCALRMRGLQSSKQQPNAQGEGTRRTPQGRWSSGRGSHEHANLSSCDSIHMTLR